MKEKIIFLMKKVMIIIFCFIFFYSFIFNLISSSKKYEITAQQTTIKHPKTNQEIQLFRIIALKDFFNVKKGDLGGFVQNYSNLSQSGNSWIYDDAKVFEEAMILDNAKVYNQSMIYEEATIMNRAIVLGDTQISSNVTLGGNTLVAENTMLCKKDTFFMKNQRFYRTPEYEFLYFENIDYYKKKRDYKRKQMIENNEIINKFQIKKEEIGRDSD